MPSLSFEKSKGSRPIAIVKGGEQDGDVLYLTENDHKPSRKVKKEIKISRYSTELRELKPMERVALIARLEEARDKGLEPDQLIGESSLAKKLYERILLDELNDKTIELADGQFQILPSPDPEKREVYYVAGASGSGKSYFAKGFAEMYKKLYPEREVYLISKLKEDETLDALRFIKRLDIQSFVDDYPDLEEFRETLTIWDDYDTITGDAGKTIQKLINDLAIMGRHTKSSMLCLTHYLSNYSKTRLLLNEATHLVFYPAATSYHALRYTLKNTVGLDDEELKDVKKWGSRWLMFSKVFPQFVVGQTRAKMLHCD
jgi:hypothetical protein